MRGESVLRRMARLFAAILGASATWGVAGTPVGVLSSSHPLSQIKTDNPNNDYVAGSHNSARLSSGSQSYIAGLRSRPGSCRDWPA